MVSYELLLHIVNVVNHDVILYMCQSLVDDKGKNKKIIIKNNLQEINLLLLTFV